MKKKYVCLTIFAILCLAFGLTLIFLWTSIFDKLLKKELILSPNSTSFKMWKETPVPMYLKIYLFNWSNAASFKYNTNVKPHFDELGPYVFREIDTKVNLIWNKNGTITFQQRRVWHFEPSMSNGSLEDKVTILNPVVATIGYMLRKNASLIERLGLSFLLMPFENLTITSSVREILFDGYNDNILKYLAQPRIKKILEKFHIKLGIPFDKFAFFYKRNGSETYDGTFNLETGENNINNLGLLNQWNFEKTSPYYPGDCSNLGGSLGDLWPPIHDNQSVSVFSPDVCTTLTLKKVGEADWLGLTGTKFVSDADMLNNGTKVKCRKCYCRDSDCMPSGVLNISKCKFGAPAFVSLPHFYLADETYRANITGMNPTKENHEFRLILQPITGTPMQVRASLQLNFLVQPHELGFFRNLPPMLVPMLWFTQEVNLTSQCAGEIKVPLLIRTTGIMLSFSLTVIGSLLVIITTFVIICQNKEDELIENLIPKDIPNTESSTENEE